VPAPAWVATLEAMTTFARRERLALRDALRATGPDGPTLCEGWTTRDLAAHIVVREHAPIGALGIWAGPLAGYTAKVQAEIAGQDWETLLEQVAAPPPLWHPARYSRRIEAAFDDSEMFIHHEDVRRGDGLARPREFSAEDQQALWRVLLGPGRLAYRKSPVGIVVEVPGHAPRTLHDRGDRVVTLRGDAGEVLLASYGRGRAADVDVDGDPDDIAALRATALGL
jgi:uncharacterized protein (TIGR03085 family)